MQVSRWAGRGSFKVSLTRNRLQISHDAFMGAMTSRGTPTNVATAYYEMYMSVADYGYFGDEDLAPSLEGLARAPRTWAQFVEATDWSKILC